MKYISLFFYIIGFVFLSPMASMLFDALWWVFNDKSFSGLSWGGLDNPRVPLTFFCTMVAVLFFTGGAIFYQNGRSK